jgi:hypothetical protein
MISNNGLLQHSGAAPGAVAWLGVHPERDFAAAILMNFGNGADLFKDLMVLSGAQATDLPIRIRIVGPVHHWTDILP